MDTVQQPMEKHTGVTMQRIVDNNSATEAMKNVLNQLFPRTIALKLFNGETVEPEFYQSATVAFT